MWRHTKDAVLTCWLLTFLSPRSLIYSFWFVISLTTNATVLYSLFRSHNHYTLFRSPDTIGIRRTPVQLNCYIIINFPVMFLTVFHNWNNPFDCSIYRLFKLLRVYITLYVTHRKMCSRVIQYTIIMTFLDVSRLVIEMRFVWFNIMNLCFH